MAIADDMARVRDLWPRQVEEKGQTYYQLITFDDILSVADDGLIGAVDVARALDAIAEATSTATDWRLYRSGTDRNPAWFWAPAPPTYPDHDMASNPAGATADALSGSTTQQPPPQPELPAHGTPSAPTEAEIPVGGPIPTAADSPVATTSSLSLVPVESDAAVRAARRPTPHRQEQ